MQGGYVLIVNCGSSSLKFAVMEPESGESVLTGLAERLGTEAAVLTVKTRDQRLERPLADSSHGAALQATLEWMPELGVAVESIRAVGHRVVHGGERFSASVLIDLDVIAGIEACSTFAPLHNPANLAGIRATQAVFTDVPQFAVFDTAFHQSMPAEAYLYAIPYEYYQRDGIRRYGFHGTSHAYVAQEAARFLGCESVAEVNLVTVHLGNGCSACAVRAGQSVDTTMGLSPLEGLAMGTRSGDVDPDLVRFLVEQKGLSVGQVSEVLNRESGLLGLSGLSHDMRTLVAAAEAGHAQAATAIDVFVHRAAKAVYAMAASLETTDAIVFTGGIGEHAAWVRGRIAKRLALLGVKLDEGRNGHPWKRGGWLVSTDASTTKAVVMPTNEEWMIARECQRLLAI